VGCHDRRKRRLIFGGGGGTSVRKAIDPWQGGLFGGEGEGGGVSYTAQGKLEVGGSGTKARGVNREGEKNFGILPERRGCHGIGGKKKALIRKKSWGIACGNHHLSPIGTSIRGWWKSELSPKSSGKKKRIIPKEKVSNPKKGQNPRV